MSVRILLVDDHQMMCDGLRALLEQEQDLEIVGEASSGRAAIALAESLSPDVVIMDIGMSEVSGVDATRQIKAQSDRVNVIALSMHSDKRHVLNMLDAGASGYVLKSSTHNELVRAVRAASVGKTYLSPEIAGHVVERSRQGDSKHDSGNDASYSVLGARELEVLKLVAEGKTSSEVALAMDISVKTVETHRRSIVQKLGLHGTAELTKYAVREGLTSIEG